MAWQPMATAPLDWTHVLVYDHGQATVCEAYYWAETDPGESLWCRANMSPDEEDSILSEPTHWMPLPEPPPAVEAP